MLEHYEDLALGMVSAQSFPAIVGTADTMLKSGNVHLVGYEKIGGGDCTAVVRGKTPDVRIAVAAGVETAEKYFQQVVSSTVIPRPMPNLEVVLPIGSLLAQYLNFNGDTTHYDQAVGLLETRGFPALVGACDAMLKAADVTLTTYHTIGDGLCTAVIRGHVSDVTAAIEMGMHEASRIGELHAIMIIPRPLPDMEPSLAPLAVVEPLRTPITIKAVEKEVIVLAPGQVLLIPKSDF